MGIKHLSGAGVSGDGPGGAGVARLREIDGILREKA
jgi:hypothetical protein